MNEPAGVEIQEARTELVITEGVGPLSREDIQKLVALVLQHVRQEQEARAQREKDTAVTNRVFPPHVR